MLLAVVSFSWWQLVSICWLWVSNLWIMLISWQKVNSRKKVHVRRPSCLSPPDIVRYPACRWHPWRPRSRTSRRMDDSLLLWAWSRLAGGKIQRTTSLCLLERQNLMRTSSLSHPCTIMSLRLTFSEHPFAHFWGATPNLHYLLKENRLFAVLWNPMYMKVKPKVYFCCQRAGVHCTSNAPYSHRISGLTKEALPGWVDNRQVVTWTSSDHQIKWPPFLNLRKSSITVSKEWGNSFMEVQYGVPLWRHRTQLNCI